MDKLQAAWEKLTPARRKKIYRIAVVIAAILAARGIVKADELKDWLEVLGLVLGVAAPALAERNTSVDD